MGLMTLEERRTAALRAAVQLYEGRAVIEAEVQMANRVIRTARVFEAYLSGNWVDNTH